jgi:hypothetical protein
MALYDLTDFLRLSATLHLQLSAQGVGWENIYQVITSRNPLSCDRERKILMRAVEYLSHAYGVRRRRIGPPAILHPLRATALLTQAEVKPQLLDMLTELLHDKHEDLTLEVLGQQKFDEVESEFSGLLKDLNPEDARQLRERLDYMALKKSESYYRYIGRLLNCARSDPALVRVKLADRLDNTLDLHIDVEDPLEGVDFFRLIFQILFPPSGEGYRPHRSHPISSPLNGAQRLYQLFKNAVLLSLIRERQLGVDDPSAQTLLEALALASMQEAQRICLHIMGYHETGVDCIRGLLMEALRYAQEGGMTRTTLPSAEHPLDGLFMKRFDYVDSRIRDQHLDDLYRDKGLMLQAAVSFVVIFLNFVYSPDFWVLGISDHGIEAANSY